MIRADDDAIVVVMIDVPHTERLSHREWSALFDRLFPNGVAGADVVAEIAPEGWEQSPLLACFHPSVDRVFDERLRFHRNIASLTRHARNRPSASETRAPLAEPTLERIRQEYQSRPVRQNEEITELVGSCLWDVFSDNHDVVTADGRVANIGSFRGAAAFLDEYLNRDNREHWCGGDYMRFYMGNAWISGRADLTLVYAMIFRRLRAIGGYWVYHFPELYIVDLSDLREEDGAARAHSLPERAAAELNTQKRATELARLGEDISASNAEAREKAMDHPPPATVRAYRHVYGCDPCGWPPV